MSLLLQAGRRLWAISTALTARSRPSPRLAPRSVEARTRVLRKSFAETYFPWSVEARTSLHSLKTPYRRTTLRYEHLRAAWWPRQEGKGGLKPEARLKPQTPTTLFRRPVRSWEGKTRFRPQGRPTQEGAV